MCVLFFLNTDKWHIFLSEVIGLKNADVDEYKREEYSEFSGYINNRKNFLEGIQVLFIMQLIACSVVLILVMVFKGIGSTSYESFKKWYVEEINRSIMAGDSNQEYKTAMKNISNIVKVKINGSTKVQASAMNATLHKPVENATITTEFSEKHKAIDLAAPKGAEIKSVLDGKVIEADTSDSYGKYIKIEHDKGVKTLYAHCDTLNVRAGDSVSEGQKIATVGSTGNSTGDHLHFELSVNDEYFDPIPMLNGEYS